MTASCSTPVIKETTPEERLAEIRKEMKKRRYEKASEILEEMRYVTAGTQLGGEVQFLLGEAAFHRGKFPEAESHYAAYLNTYKDGPYTEQSVYMQAVSKVKQIEKRKVGFLSLNTYIPHDRDISLIRESRVLFEIYMDLFPEGQWIDTATQRAKVLLSKEGEHELEIAAFYLRKKNPSSAIARAKRVLEGEYPENIKSQARELMMEAQQQLSSPGDS